MTASPEEFATTLRGGFTSPESGLELQDIAADQWRINWQAQGLSVGITTQPAPARNLGALTLPQLNVTLTFPDTNSASRQAFLTRFHHYFHKGGG